MGSSDDTTLWGSSSLLVQVTLVPALTLIAAGMNEKLSTVTAGVATAASVAGVEAGAAISRWAGWSAPAAAPAAWLGPPQAVRPTAANEPVARPSRARRDKGSGMGSTFLDTGRRPVRGLSPGRYGRGLQAPAG